MVGGRLLGRPDTADGVETPVLADVGQVLEVLKVSTPRRPLASPAPLPRLNPYRCLVRISVHSVCLRTAGTLAPTASRAAGGLEARLRPSCSGVLDGVRTLGLRADARAARRLGLEPETGAIRQLERFRAARRLRVLRVVGQ